MEAKVYRQDGTDAGRSVALDAAVFGVEPNDHAIWLDVRRIQSNARQGTHKAKERSEVAGSTRKLYRQKGTGNARAGSAKSPIRRSGGTIFGPRPRDYDVRVNRKTQRLARRSALSYKAQADAIRLVEAFSMDAPSARALAALMREMDLSDRRLLLLTADNNAALYQSGRNMKNVTVRPARDVSTLDVMQASVVLLEEGALELLSTQLAPAPAAVQE